MAWPLCCPVLLIILLDGDLAVHIDAVAPGRELLAVTFRPLRRARTSARDPLSDIGYCRIEFTRYVEPHQ